MKFSNDSKLKLTTEKENVQVCT